MRSRSASRSKTLAARDGSGRPPAIGVHSRPPQLVRGYTQRITVAPATLKASDTGLTQDLLFILLILSENSLSKKRLTSSTELWPLWKGLSSVPMR